MDRADLYWEIAERKASVEHTKPYTGGNGRIDRFLDLIRSGVLPGGGKVLDVGGSHGDLVDISLREGIFSEGHVIDISRRSCEVAQGRGITAWAVDVDQDGLRIPPVTLAGYDCIVALDFIEHIIDPGNFARECRRALNPGGYVFINTPNISYWKHLESLVVHGRFPHTSGDREVYHGGHLAFYNENDINDIFSAAGFSGNVTVHDDPSAPDEPIPPIWSNLLKETPFKRRSMLANPNLLMSVFRNK